ncbi:MAG: alpha/beta hydrolase, partial [Mycolicibacterium sp.]
MGSRWTVLIGTGFIAATMSGMVVLGVPTAFAAPGDTETTSATESDTPSDAAPAETSVPDTEPEDEQSAPDDDIDADTPPLEVDLEAEDLDRKHHGDSMIDADGDVVDDVVG